MIARVRIDTAQDKLCFYDIFFPWQNTFQSYNKQRLLNEGLRKLRTFFNFWREPGLLFTFIFFNPKQLTMIYRTIIEFNILNTFFILFFRFDFSLSLSFKNSYF